MDVVVEVVERRVQLVRVIAHVGADLNPTSVFQYLEVVVGGHAIGARGAGHSGRQTCRCERCDGGETQPLATPASVVSKC